MQELSCCGNVAPQEGLETSEAPAFSKHLLLSPPVYSDECRCFEQKTMGRTRSNPDRLCVWTAAAIQSFGTSVMLSPSCITIQLVINRESIQELMHACLVLEKPTAILG